MRHDVFISHEKFLKIIGHIERHFNWFSYAYDIKYHIYIKRFYISHHILTLHLQIEWKTVSLFVYRIIFNFEHVNHSFHWLLNDFGVTMQMHWHWGWLPVIYYFIRIFIYIERYRYVPKNRAWILAYNICMNICTYNIAYEISSI